MHIIAVIGKHFLINNKEQKYILKCIAIILNMVYYIKSLNEG